MRISIIPVITVLLFVDSSPKISFTSKPSKLETVHRKQLQHCPVTCKTYKTKIVVQPLYSQHKYFDKNTIFAHCYTCILSYNIFVQSMFQVTSNCIIK